jgi:hypothetical protein
MNSTRRSVLGRIALAMSAVPVAIAMPIAMPAPALAESGGIDWGHWELEIGYACSHVTYFDDEITLADKAFKRWESRNPWPAEPDYSSHGERIADFQRLKSAQSAHCERYQNALRQCGRGALKKERSEASDEYAAVCQHIADLQIFTLNDLKEKSRVARFEYAGGPIKQALLKDLQSI